MFRNMFNINKIQKMPSRESEIAEVVHQQEVTICLLRDQVSYLKDEVALLRVSICSQRDEFEALITKQKAHFEKEMLEQKEIFTEGVKTILLTLENERLNNDRLIQEIQDLRDKNHSLLLELSYYKTHPRQ